jgi:uncharacterized membrane protein
MSYSGRSTDPEPLTHHMDLSSVRDELGMPARNTRSSRFPAHRNVGTMERLISAVAGGALLANAIRSRSTGGLFASLAGGAALLHRGMTGKCSVYHQLGVNTADEGRQGVDVRLHAGIEVEHSTTINRPVEEVFQFWRNLENLPRFMENLESVEVTSQTRSHWRAKAPAGMSVEWEATIINERQNELIAWQSVEGSDIDTAGSVRFRPDAAGRGTEVRVNMRYNPPAGKIGHAVAKMMHSDPKVQIREDMRRMKQLLESGEVPTVEGQPRGSC